MDPIFWIFGILIGVLLLIIGAIKAKEAFRRAQFKKIFGVLPYTAEPQLLRKGIEIVLDGLQKEIAAIDKIIEEKRQVIATTTTTTEGVKKLNEELMTIGKRRSLVSRRLTERKKVATGFGHGNLVKDWQNKQNNPLQY